MCVDRGWGGGQSTLISNTTKLQRDIQHYFCLIHTRNVDFEWYPWTMENWQHCLGPKRLYIPYNIIIISFGMRFSAFELHSVVVHVFVLVLFLKRYTRRAKMTSTLSRCSLLYITEALSNENLCSVSYLNALWVPWTVQICQNNTHLKQAAYLHCTVEIGHFAWYPVRLKRISDPFKDIRNETIYHCVNGDFFQDVNTILSRI